MLIKKYKSLFTPWNLLVLIILLLAFFLRIYRIGDFLDFHYDQGRDAQIIWDLWYEKKLFLIGPVTGLEGVFLGPFYYYLIAPFYLIGAGNPVIPSIFLSFLTVIALFVLYLTGTEIYNKETGLIALIVGSFSNFIIFSNRWLSNPTPIYLTSILIFYNMIKIVKSTPRKCTLNWYLIYILVGVSLHFEAASAVFYLPILMIFSLWRKPKITIFVVSSLFLLITFLPQIVFNFKHDNILFTNIISQVGTNSAKLDIMVRIKDIWITIKTIF